ncbi:hypothetical protein VIGAN_08359500, partial [Vigna angularis var. angularis]
KSDPLKSKSIFKHPKLDLPKWICTRWGLGHYPQAHNELTDAMNERASSWNHHRNPSAREPDRKRNHTTTEREQHWQQKPPPNSL